MARRRKIRSSISVPITLGAVTVLLSVALLVGWSFLLGQKIDGNEARMFFGEADAELKALLRDLDILEGRTFVETFVEQVVAGRPVQAFGPWEHIDVRETKKRREIKLRIITKVLAGQKKRAGVEFVEPRVG